VPGQIRSGGLESLIITLSLKLSEGREVLQTIKMVKKRAAKSVMKICSLDNDGNDVKRKNDNPKGNLR